LKKFKVSSVLYGFSSGTKKNNQEKNVLAWDIYFGIILLFVLF